MIALQQLCHGKGARARACVWRSATIGIALLMLSGGLTAASAAWSGFWTFTPAAGTWVWTWVWTVPSTAGIAASAQPRGAADLTSAAREDCCGITIFGFDKLKPASIERTGLLAADFVIEPAYRPDASDLTLQYIGQATLNPGTFLGLMTLTAPDALPGSTPPVELAFEESFLDGSGAVLRDQGVISSAVSAPEPGSLALSLAFLLAIFVCVRAGCRAAKASSSPGPHEIISGRRFQA